MNNFHAFSVETNLKKNLSYLVTLENIETIPQTRHLYGWGGKKLVTVLS